jgi:cellulose synthase/poly-beta-1,6-N-acetylglucosamine synthase-like glycosyltransferase
MNWHRILVDFVTWFILLYFILLNGGYLALNLLSMRTLHRKGQEEILDDLPRAYSGLEPPVSILVPAYNEEATIAASVRSMLQLTYAEYEVVVINDGSKDATIDVLIREFGLLPFPEAYRRQLPSADVRAIYRSTRHPNLRVIDKENGGKADALNAGINAARAIRCSAAWTPIRSCSATAWKRWWSPSCAIRRWSPPAAPCAWRTAAR